MEMILRWYGSRSDTVTLKQIRQIQGVTGVITILYDTQPGGVWSREWICAMKEKMKRQGFMLLETKELMFMKILRWDWAIGTSIFPIIWKSWKIWKEDIHLVCYGFMPVFDWIRIELARVREDSSAVLTHRRL